MKCQKNSTESSTFFCQCTKMNDPKIQNNGDYLKVHNKKKQACIYVFLNRSLSVAHPVLHSHFYSPEYFRHS